MSANYYLAMSTSPFLGLFHFYDTFYEGSKEVFYNGAHHPAPRGYFFQKLGEKDPCLNSDFDGLFGDAILDKKAIATTYMPNGSCHAVVVVGMNDQGFFAKNTYTDCSLTVIPFESTLVGYYINFSIT